MPQKTLSFLFSFTLISLQAFLAFSKHSLSPVKQNTQSRGKTFKHVPGTMFRTQMKCLWLEKKKGSQLYSSLGQFKLCLAYKKSFSGILFNALFLFSSTEVESEQGGKPWFGGGTSDSFFHHTNSGELSFRQIVTITPNSICYEAMVAIKNRKKAALDQQVPLPPIQFVLIKISQIRHFYLQITHTYRMIY